MLNKHADVFRYRTAQRIRWAEKFVRNYKERTVKRITEWRAISVRWIGGQRGGREGEVSADVGKLSIRNCSKMAIDREDVRKLLSRPKFTVIGSARRRTRNQLHGTECCVR